jgi:threonine dehydratase
MAGASLFFKCESFQKVGAFKFRGACHAVLSLSDEEAQKGVATHSSGNHAAALALAAKIRGIPAFVVMPSDAPLVKKQAVEGYGATITFCEPTLEARQTTLEKVISATGATEIHPYDNPMIIAGQATAAVELLEEIPDLDVIICPVGGGGFLGGTALAAHYFSPDTRVIAAEPANANDAYRSWKAGEWQPSIQPDTIADGLKTSLGQLGWAILQKHVSEVVTVPEDDIVHAMRTVWERMKILIEPSSAVPVAALLTRAVSCENLRVGVLISGGNVDLSALPWSRE